MAIGFIVPSERTGAAGEEVEGSPGLNAFETGTFGGPSTAPGTTRLKFAFCAAALLGVLAAGCKAGTLRPYFPPVTGAPQTEIELKVPDATEALTDVLKGDSIPVAKFSTRDGFVESEWFKADTKSPTHARKLGDDVVQVRAWVDPSRPGHSRIVIETVYRPLADPSLSGRELDRQVPPDHPIGKRMNEIITQLAKLYTTEPDST